MKQMDIPNHLIVEVDFDNDSLSKAFKDLRPVIWRDERGYSCLLGPDPQEGILGVGNTKEAAMDDWEANVRARVRTAATQDEVGQYVIDTLKISKDDVW